jgi:hypothetical protein
VYDSTPTFANIILIYARHYEQPSQSISVAEIAEIKCPKEYLVAIVNLINRLYLELSSFTHFSCTAYDHQKHFKHLGFIENDQGEFVKKISSV